MSAPLLHGGVAGLQPGDLILPPARTGTVGHRRDVEGGPVGYDPRRVYATAELQYAQWFAYMREGAVYEVLLQGQVRPDRASLVAPSWSGRRAQVLRVIVPAPAPMPRLHPGVDVGVVAEIAERMRVGWR